LASIAAASKSRHPQDVFGAPRVGRRAVEAGAPRVAAVVRAARTDAEQVVPLRLQVAVQAEDREELGGRFAGRAVRRGDAVARRVAAFGRPPGDPPSASRARSTDRSNCAKP
jgi:hypothetical protein